MTRGESSLLSRGGGVVVPFRGRDRNQSPRSRCQTKKGKRTRDEKAWRQWNDAKMTEHHTIPRSRGGTVEDIILKPWGVHRRWHEIFDLATPHEASRDLEEYAAKCGIITTKKGVIVDFRQARKRRKERTKILRLREAWTTLFGTLSLAAVRQMISAEWTVPGVRSPDRRAIA